MTPSPEPFRSQLSGQLWPGRESLLLFPLTEEESTNQTATSKSDADKSSVKLVESFKERWALANREVPWGPGVTHCGLRRISGKAGRPRLPPHPMAGPAALRGLILSVFPPWPSFQLLNSRASCSKSLHILSHPWVTLGRLVNLFKPQFSHP